MLPLFKNKKFMLAKCPIETLQSLPYFWDTKIHIVFCFSFWATLCFPNECHKCPNRLGPFIRENIKWHKMENEKTTWVFIFQKYGKFWSVSLGHFSRINLLLLKSAPPRSFYDYTISIWPLSANPAATELLSTIRFGLLACFVLKLALCY